MFFWMLKKISSGGTSSLSTHYIWHNIYFWRVLDRTVKHIAIRYVFFDLHSKLNMKQIYEITGIK